MEFPFPVMCEIDLLVRLQLNKLCMIKDLTRALSRPINATIGQSDAQADSRVGLRENN